MKKQDTVGAPWVCVQAVPELTSPVEPGTGHFQLMCHTDTQGTLEPCR